MVGSEVAEVTEWRLSGAVRWLQIALGVLAIGNGLLHLVLDFGRADRDQPQDLLFVLDPLAALLGLVMIFYLLRVRVRALVEGVEIRRFRVRTIGYGEIEPASLNRFSGDVELVLRGGALLTLPAPRRGDPRMMAAAVEAIEYRRLLAGMDDGPGETGPGSR